MKSAIASEIYGPDGAGFYIVHLWPISGLMSEGRTFGPFLSRLEADEFCIVIRYREQERAERQQKEQRALRALKKQKKKRRGKVAKPPRRFN